MQVYTAQDELDEWKIQLELKESYGYEDESKEWLSMKKAHIKKWKLIKAQAGKAAGSGRGGGGSGKKMQFSWKHVAEINGEDLSLGGVWTQELAAKHFDIVYKFENDTPRGGHVSRDSEVFKCRKYIADVDGHPRIYIRVVEIEEGTDGSTRSSRATPSATTTTRTTLAAVLARRRFRGARKRLRSLLRL